MIKQGRELQNNFVHCNILCTFLPCIRYRHPASYTIARNLFSYVQLFAFSNFISALKNLVDFFLLLVFFSDYLLYGGLISISWRNYIWPPRVLNTAGVLFYWRKWRNYVSYGFRFICSFFFLTKLLTFQQKNAECYGFFNLIDSFTKNRYAPFHKPKNTIEQYSVVVVVVVGK